MTEEHPCFSKPGLKHDGESAGPNISPDIRDSYIYIYIFDYILFLIIYDDI